MNTAQIVMPSPLAGEGSPGVQHAQLGEGLRPRPLTGLCFVRGRAARSRKGRGQGRIRHENATFCARFGNQQTADLLQENRPRMVKQHRRQNGGLTLIRRFSDFERQICYRLRANLSLSSAS